MHRLAGWILKHRFFILIAFTVATLISILLIPLVKVNYDMTDYLPAQAPSTLALKHMRETFKEDLPDAQVMVEVSSTADALQFKKELESLDVVQNVLWLDDQADVTLPPEMQNPSLLKVFYQDKMALYHVTTRNDFSTVYRLEQLQSLRGNQTVVRGPLVDLARSQSSVTSEMGRIMMYAIPIGTLLLILCTASWIEPLLLLLSILIAVALNMATNLVIGSVSFITHSVAAILQMAVSLDYAVFLMHAFARKRGEGMPIELALREAIVESFSSITASALTTFFGFLSLVFMRFRIGPDLGFVLAKSIFFSLFCTLFFLPALVLSTYKLIDRTTHRPILPSFRKLSHFVLRARAFLLILPLILVIPCFLAQQKNSFTYGNGSYPEASREFHDREAVREVFGDIQQMVVLVPRGDTAKEQALTQALQQVPEIYSVSGYVNLVGAELPEEMIPPDQLSKLVSGPYRRYFVVAESAPEAPETFLLAEKIRDICAGFYGDNAELIGENFSLLDMRQIVRSDNIIVNGLAILTVGVVILITFRSLLLPLLLLFVIELAIWINLSVPYFSGDVMSYIGYLVISTIQLGATVDYAILLTRYWLKYRQKHSKKAALVATLMDTTGSIFTPALILATMGFILGFISSISVISELGVILGRGALLTMLLVLLFLPAALYFCDPLVEKLTLKLHFAHPSHEEAERELNRALLFGPAGIEEMEKGTEMLASDTGAQPGTDGAEEKDQ